MLSSNTTVPALLGTIISSKTSQAKMPPKSRDFKAKAKSKPSNPQSEVEYLEAADEFEQAGVSSALWFVYHPTSMIYNGQLMASRTFPSIVQHTFLIDVFPSPTAARLRVIRIHTTSTSGHDAKFHI